MYQHRKIDAALILGARHLCRFMGQGSLQLEGARFQNEFEAHPEN